jgi:anaerobic magnesium-protoporphyrin IX monomethyl ester cyclase
MRVAGIYPQPMDFDALIQHLYGQPTGLEQVLGTCELYAHEAKLFCPLGQKGESFYSIPVEQFVAQIIAYAPDVLALSIMTCQYSYARQVADMVKKKMPDVVVVAGGRHPTFAVEDLAYPFDIYVLGEGEATFVDLLAVLENGHDLRQVAGIALRDGDDKIHITEPRPLLSDLMTGSIRKLTPELLNFIYRGLSIPPMSARPRYALVEYSRGCAFACHFCDNEGVWRAQQRHRDARAVVAEMKALCEQFDTTLFYIIDLNFTLNHRRVYQFCDEAAKQNLHANWYCMSNISTVDRDLLQAMKEAGCFKVCYGVESTSNASLKKMAKSLKRGNLLLQVEETQRVLRVSHDVGMINNMYFIIGFPWETEKDILGGQSLLNQYCGHEINIGIFTPHYGTVMYNEMAEQGYQFSSDLSLYNRGSLVYNHATLTSQQIQALKSKLYQEFYECDEYAPRLDDLIERQPHLARSFNDYFEYYSLNVEASVPDGRTNESQALTQQ